MTASHARMAALLAAVRVLAACGPAAGPGVSADPELTEALLTQNGLVIGNGTPMNLLLAHPLSAEGLALQPSTVLILAGDPGTQAFFSYLVSCALPADQTLRVTTEAGDVLEFPGGVGVAAEWAEGPCDQGCQEWVSSCLYARVNRYGVTVSILMVGTHPVLRGGPEEEPEAFMQEGAFYGNLWEDPPRAYACRGDGYDPIRTTFRQCAQPGNPCTIQSVAPCGEIDGHTGARAARRACERFDAEAGAYTDCHNRPTYEGFDEFPPSTTYPRPITVYLRRTSYTYSRDGGGAP